MVLFSSIADMLLPVRIPGVVGRLLFRAFRKRFRLKGDHKIYLSYCRGDLLNYGVDQDGGGLCGCLGRRCRDRVEQGAWRHQDPSSSLGFVCHGLLPSSPFPDLSITSLEHIVTKCRSNWMTHGGLGKIRNPYHRLKQSAACHHLTTVKTCPVRGHTRSSLTHSA